MCIKILVFIVGETMPEKRYCGTKDVCFYKNQYENNECLAYNKPETIEVWRTCNHKWRPQSAIKETKTEVKKV